MHIKTQCHLHTSSPQPPPIPVKFSTRTRPGIVDLKFPPANYLLFTKRPKSVIPSKHKWKRLSRFTKCPCFNFIKQGLNYSRQHRSVHTTRDWGLPSSLDIKAVVGFIKIKSEGGGGWGIGIPAKPYAAEVRETFGRWKYLTQSGQLRDQCFHCSITPVQLPNLWPPFVSCFTSRWDILWEIWAPSRPWNERSLLDNEAVEIKLHNAVNYRLVALNFWLNSTSWLHLSSWIEPVPSNLIYIYRDLCTDAIIYSDISANK